MKHFDFPFFSVKLTKNTIIRTFFFLLLVEFEPLWKGKGRKRTKIPKRCNFSKHLPLQTKQPLNPAYP